MKSLRRNLNWLFTFILLLVVPKYVYPISLGRTKGVNGGVPCAGCTFVVGVLQQLADIHNESVAKAVAHICKFFKDELYRDACYDIIKYFGPTAIKYLDLKFPPDCVCHELKLCYNEEKNKPMCHLFPVGLKKCSKYREKLRRSNGVFNMDQRDDILLKFNTMMQALNQKPLKYSSESSSEKDIIDSLCKLPGIKFICDLISKVLDSHTPALDLDGDGHSTMETLRGVSWTGRDCNDLNPRHKPGARAVGGDLHADSNCNGVYGVDETGESYEEKFCGDSGQLGVALIGDSAGAHFHIPKEWVQSSLLSPDMLTNLKFVIENEFDWPMTSAATGFKNVTWPIVHGHTQSLYHFLRQRNRCNHRDYQNLGVNGADSFKTLFNMRNLARNASFDHPMLVMFELVGNDVCNQYWNTLANMTTPAEMKQNFIDTLYFLNSRLPRGSHVLVMGLADGSDLYKLLHKRFHPVGVYRSDVTYPQFYDFLNCLEISPCFGWMNTNATIRDLTTQRARELSAVLKAASREFRFALENIDLHYMDCPLSQIWREWEDKHGPNTAYQLIEPVDGFHPNQKANALLAEYVFNYLEKNVPHFIGKTNPYNQQIADIFGDQGGY